MNPRLRALMVVAPLALAACAGGSRHTARLSAATAPPPPSTTTTKMAAPPPPTTIATPPVPPAPVATTGCTGKPAIDRNWQESAPRPSQSTDAPLTIGLRNKLEGPTGMEAAAGVTGSPNWLIAAPDVPVTARVTGPDGRTYESHPVSLLPNPSDSWIYLDYPRDFPGAPTQTSGSYTVVWNTDAGPLVCDAFTLT